jgi:hypothetical protein
MGLIKITGFALLYWNKISWVSCLNLLGYYKLEKSVFSGFLAQGTDATKFPKMSA